MGTPYALTAAVLAASAFFVLAPRPVSAAGSNTGNLSFGGTAKGDISDEAGEFDAITVDLVAGSKLSVKWSSGFAANVALFAPDGSPVALGLDAVTKGAVPAVSAAATGTYRFEIRSSDGSQGLYTLQAKPFWDKTVVFEGTGEQTFDVPMPATCRVKGKVQPLPGASNPSILSFTDPNGTNLLAAPVVGSPGVAKLKTTNCGVQGTYRFTALASAGTQGFRATLKRTAPKIPMAKIDVSNGINQVGYAASGIERYFKTNCASCHSWAATYAGVRAYSRNSLGRMRTGNMPPGGPRTDDATLALVGEWIKTGYGR